MQTSINFLLIVLLICAFFTLGRWTGWQEERTREHKIQPKSKPIVRKIEKKVELNRKKFNFENHLEDRAIIDAEYEDVVDLQKYIKRRDSRKEQSVDETSEFTFIYSKRDDRLIRVPREISDLLDEIKNLRDDIDTDTYR
jgi:hypothetical protein